MAAEVRNFAATIPAGTPITAPVTVSLAMPPRIVRAVRWRVPPGPAGVMGWALAAAGVAIIPWNVGGWIVANDEYDEWPLDGQISSGAWQVQGYNTGVYAHAVFLTFLLDPVSAGPPAFATAPLALAN